MLYKKGDFVGNRYFVEIIDCMEVKASSELYLGKLKGTELKIVVKVSNHLVQNEYEILSGLRYPGIPRVIDFLCASEYSYMLMPYYKGLSLEQVILKNGALSHNSVLNISKNLCEILMFLQGRENTILHNDIKPSNILWKEDGSIVLLDFGLASYEGEKREDLLFQGTPGYAAPECWHQKDMPLTKTSDIFAFGATIYRLLTGEKPGAHYGKFIVYDEEKKEQWQPFINKCCTLEAKYRYQNAAQVLDALNHIQIK